MNCIHKECKSEKVLFPTFKFWAEGFTKDSHDPILMKVRTPLCAEHKDDFEVKIKDNLAADLNVMNKKLGRHPVDPENYECEWSDDDTN